MSQPAHPRSEQPGPDGAAEAQPLPESVPLNRAARRAKSATAEPSHVGPRGDLLRQVRGARPHAKRRRG